MIKKSLKTAKKLVESMPKSVWELITNRGDQWRSQPKISGGETIGLSTVQWRTQDWAKEVAQPGVWGQGFRRHDFLFFYKKNIHFRVGFLSKKETRVSPSGFNPPLLALLIDLRFFVCRLVVTENILGGQLPPLLPPLATPLEMTISPVENSCCCFEMKIG